MNKESYLDELRKSLKVLPQVDRDETIEFYKEYFEDAGIENEAAVIEELGSPKELAKKILVDVVDKKFSSEEQDDAAETDFHQEGHDNKKKKENSALRTFLVVMAAILALPLSPILFALLITLFALTFAFIIVFISIIACGVVMFAVGLVVAIAALFLLPVGIGKALLMLGTGLVTLGLGILFVIGFAKLLSLFCNGVAALFAKIVHSKK
ncbi:MAG: DUF1700 domain-containing protein [Clostridia bacterium]|nr:DUF1700 domain-containing protein [Clostridia bacterium]